MNPTKTLTAALVLGTLLGAGCANTSSPNTQRGAVAGAATGAVLGGIIGHQSGETGAGAAIGAAAGGIAGAAIGNNADRRAETAADRGYTVQQVPLAPTSTPYEGIPPKPSNNAVWVPGYHEYTGQGDQYQWVAGHWEVPPPGTHSWHPPTWQPTGSGYVYVRGQWR